MSKTYKSDNFFEKNKKNDNSKPIKNKKGRKKLVFSPFFIVVLQINRLQVPNLFLFQLL